MTTSVRGAAVSEPRAPSADDLSPPVLVVSEDPFFIERARALIGSEGGRVVACLGPTASPCILDEKLVCPLAARAAVALVDAPAGGVFRHHWKEMPAGDYAARLQRAHPQTFVLLCVAAVGQAGPTGEVHVGEGRDEALRQLVWLLRTNAIARASEGSLTRNGGWVMRLKELKPRMPVTIAKAESLTSAGKLLADEEIGALVVFEPHGMAGVISERDVVRAVADGCDLDATEVCEYMTSAPVVIDDDALVGDAIAKMNESGIRHVVVTSDGDVSGVISMRDVVALLADHWLEL